MSRWPNAQLVPLMVGFSCIAEVASAVPVVQPGFVIEEVATFTPGGQFGIAVAPPSFGAFAGQVFMADRGVFTNLTDGGIYRIDPSTGQVTLFASLGGDAIWLAFSQVASFGTDLYVSQTANPSDTTRGMISRITPSGLVSLFGSQSIPTAHRGGGGGIAFSDGGPFGAFLYSSTASGNLGDAITKLGPAGGNAAVLHHNFGIIDGNPNGNEFGPGSEGFSSDLYVAIFKNTTSGLAAGVYRIDSTGARTPFVTTSDTPLITSLADLKFGLGGEFGRSLYVTDTTAKKVLRIESDGTVQDFVTGLGGGRGLAFADINTMYVLDAPNGHLYRVRPVNPVPALSEWGLAVTGLLLLTGGTLLLRRRRQPVFQAMRFVRGPS